MGHRTQVRTPDFLLNLLTPDSYYVTDRSMGQNGSR